MQLLNTFFKGIILAYQMVIDNDSGENFNTRNPEEVVTLIENLASSNSTKNTCFERRKSCVSLGNEPMDEVKAKMDGVHKQRMYML